MSTNDPAVRKLLDAAAIALQGLRQDRRLRWDTLVRIDNTAEAAAAPYQFDAAQGLVHRRTCRAIPAGAALYGLAHITRDDLNRACKRCKPLPDQQPPPTDTTERADLLFGLVSVIDQFAGVLKERGKDYQKTNEGQQLGAQLDAVYRTLDRRQKEVLDTVLMALDQVVERLRTMDSALKRNGTERND